MKYYGSFVPDVLRTFTCPRRIYEKQFSQFSQIDGTTHLFALDLKVFSTLNTRLRQERKKNTLAKTRHPIKLIL